VTSEKYQIYISFSFKLMLTVTIFLSPPDCASLYGKQGIAQG